MDGKEIDNIEKKLKDAVLIIMSIGAIIGTAVGFFSLPGQVDANTASVEKIKQDQNEMKIVITQIQSDISYIKDGIKRLEKKMEG